MTNPNSKQKFITNRINKVYGVRNWGWPLTECQNTEFVWELENQRFVKVAVRRAFCLQVCFDFDSHFLWIWELGSRTQWVKVHLMSR